MPERNRDQSLDTMLRQVLSAQTTPADVCLDAETVAAWTAGALPANVAADIDMHLAHCSRCQAVVAALVRTTPEPVAPEPLWRRWHLRWFVPLATAATAVAIWVATPGQAPPVQESAATQAPRELESFATAPAPPAPLELERPAAPQPVRKERDASRDENRQTLESSRESPLADRAAAPPAAAPPPAGAAVPRSSSPPATAAEATDLQKAEPSAAQFRALATSVPTVIEIRSPGEMSRWRITNGQQVEWTPSDSAAWQPAAIAASDPVSAGMSPSPSVCWLVGRRGTVFLTTNGSRFVRLPFREMVDLVSVTAVDEREATVMAADGRRFTTQDRGTTWTVVR